MGDIVSKVWALQCCRCAVRWVHVVVWLPALIWIHFHSTPLSQKKLFHKSGVQINCMLCQQSQHQIIDLPTRYSRYSSGAGNDDRKHKHQDSLTFDRLRVAVRWTSLVACEMKTDVVWVSAVTYRFSSRNCETRDSIHKIRKNVKRKQHYRRGALLCCGRCCSIDSLST